MDRRSRFASRLRWWRARRGMSQLALALAAGVSQRHVSFLEVDRAAPSRDMVLRLAAALDLPLRQQNALLTAAGYAARWREEKLGAPALAAVERTLGFMLAQQEPFPAFVLDRRWNVLDANGGARRLVGFLTGGPPPAGALAPLNLADALLAPDGLRPLVANWAEVARHFVRGVQADAHHDGTAETAALLDRLTAYPDVAGLARSSGTDERHDPVLAMELVRDGTRLGLFTAIATLGTPQDVTLQELRIESFFPADEATAAIMRGWAAPPPSRPPRRR